MMRRVCAIALLTLRAAIRSRVVLALCGLLAAVLTGLPALIAGDGTAEGTVRLTLVYTLGTAFGLLAFATLWTACAVVSGEIDSGTVQLTLVKPVHGVQLWLGKWLGILILDAGLLAVASSAAYATLSARVNPADPGSAALLRARVAHAPEMLSPRAEAEALVARISPPPTGWARQAAVRSLAAEVPYRSRTIHRDQSATWCFRLDQPPATDEPLWVRLRFDADYSTRTQVKGVCRLAPVGGGEGVEAALDDFSTREIEIAFPSAPFTGVREVELTIRHTGGPASGALLIQPRRGLSLLVPRGGLAGNLLRALAMHLALLALLAALGLTFGTLFSLPVAAFSATGLLLAALISAYVVADPWAMSDAADEGRQPGLTDRVAYAVTDAIARISRPAREPRPLRQLAAAERIPGRELARAWLWNGLFLPACCAGLSALALRRREIAR